MVEVRLLVGGGELYANAGLALGHDGVKESDDINAFVEQAGGKFLSQRRIVEHDGDDGVLAGQQVEAGGAHALAEIAGIVLELVAQVGGGAEEFEYFNGGANDGRRQCIGEQVGTGALAQHVHDFLFSGSEAPGSTAQCFAKGAGDDIDAIHDPAMLDGASAGFAHEAGGMAFVHHDHSVVAVGEVANLVEFGDAAVHGEDAVSGDQAAAGTCGGLKLGFEVGHVVVFIAKTLGFAEANTIDDGGVIELVGDDGIFGAEQGLEQAAVGIEGGGVEDGIFLAYEFGNFLLQLLVDILGAADEPHRRKSETVSADGFDGGFNDLGVGRESQVVIGAEIQYFASLVSGDGCPLGRGDDALRFIKAGVFDFLQFLLEGGFYVLVHIEG